MQPYQQAAEETRRHGEMPLRAAQNAVGVGGALATGFLGGSALNRVIPFLSKYIPEDLAIKGLSKVDPRFGKFIAKAKASGKTFGEIKEFIESKADKAVQDQKNIIQQESPELHQFIDQEIRGGMTPLQAGAKASVDKKFTDVIKKLVKSHKMPWANILETIYGSAEQALPKSSQPQGQQQQQQPGQGQQALMSILNQINQRLGQ